MGYITISLAVMLIIVSVPFLIWKIPPNGIAGVRCSKTLTPGNEEIWYKVNRFAAKVFVACSILMTLIAALALIYKTSLSSELYLYINLGAMHLPFVAVAIIIIYLVKA